MLTFVDEQAKFVSVDGNGNVKDIVGFVAENLERHCATVIFTKQGKLKLFEHTLKFCSRLASR